MEKITITIKGMGNAAFEIGERKELARIIREVANKVENGYDTIVPRDINGNTIGKVEIE